MYWLCVGLLRKGGDSRGKHAKALVLGAINTSKVRRRVEAACQVGMGTCLRRQARCGNDQPLTQVRLSGIWEGRSDLLRVGYYTTTLITTLITTTLTTTTISLIATTITTLTTTLTTTTTLIATATTTLSNTTITTVLSTTVLITLTAITTINSYELG